MEELKDYLTGAELLIHNAPFDVGFLESEFAIVGDEFALTSICTITDTLAMARKMYPGQRNSLDALCKRLGVSLTVSSTLGVGSCFQVAIPLEKQRESLAQSASALQVTTAANWQHLRVLVVDDSATIRRSAETMLAKEGCEVITAENGFEALSKITRHKPDLIFVDIMMPRLDGYQTCAIIKNNAEFRDTPVVMLTSKDGLFDMARGRVVGSDQYLTKPFTREELLGAVKQHAAA